MFKTLVALMTVIFFTFNTTPTDAISKVEELPDCIILTHCVREELPVNKLEESFTKAIEAVSKLPRTRITKESELYIHAESKTMWRRYTDDLLLKGIPEKSVIQIRSESRIGIGDNGVNQKRINKLNSELKKMKIIK